VRRGAQDPDAAVLGAAGRASGPAAGAD